MTLEQHVAVQHILAEMRRLGFAPGVWEVALYSFGVVKAKPTNSAVLWTHAPQMPQLNGRKLQKIFGAIKIGVTLEA